MAALGVALEGLDRVRGELQPKGQEVLPLESEVVAALRQEVERPEKWRSKAEREWTQELLEAAERGAAREGRES